MKRQLVPLAALVAVASIQAQTVLTPQRSNAIRAAIQQSQVRSAGPAATRQLTPEERAELRRQVRLTSAKPGRP
jgi:hypothetical protein